MSLTTNFVPVARRTVAEEIRARLVEAIRTGVLIPGAALPAERILCQEFGVARTSVREAIQGMVTAGYLDRRGNRPIVAERMPSIEFSVDDRKAAVRQLFEVRRVIEPAMGELAARRATPEQRDELRALSLRTPRELDDFRAIDRSFHALIAVAAGNPLLAEVHAKALTALFGSGQFASLLYAEINRTEVRDIIRSATEAHRSISSSLAAGHSAKTVAAILEHLNDVERRMVERLV